MNTMLLPFELGVGEDTTLKILVLDTGSYLNVLVFS